MAEGILPPPPSPQNGLPILTPLFSTANGGTYFLLDGGDVVGECADGMLTAIYARGINLISRITAESIEYYLHNAHGDVVALTNDSGALKKSYDYDAFGNEKNPSTSDSNPFRYCGEYFDKETKTYYLRARYYDPAIGRFTQQDSVLFTTRKLVNDYEYVDPLSLNLYTYCYNNPAMYLDRSGHVPYADLNRLSWLYNTNYYSPQMVSSHTISNTIGNLHLAFHQIAQLNLAKVLYTMGYSPILEYRIPKVGRVDVVAGGMAWEVKVMPLSGAKQMEKYMNEGGLLAGHEFMPILGVPILDDYKMGIVSSLIEPGVAHYFFYRQNEQKEYQIVTNMDVIAAYREKYAQFATPATGQHDLGYAIFMLIALSCMGGAMGELEPSMTYVEP